MADTENGLKRPLYSWIDVDLVADQKRAAGVWPNWLFAASAYHDGLLLRVKPRTERAQIDGLLEDWYGARYNQKQGLLFEGPEDHGRKFPIEVEESDTAVLPFQIQPTFRRVSVLPNSPTVAWPNAFEAGTPPIVAFYSFKGGVGRTTSLLAFLVAFSGLNPTSKALIIDADLEAPGITTLAEADRTISPARFSFVDFLAISNSDPSEDFREALDIAAYATRRQIVQVRAQDKLTDHFLLPAHRSEDQFLRLDIRPENLLNGTRSRWSVGDLVTGLGRRLGVGIVLVDLRAGLSELASPFLFDPRLRRIIVTTPSEQSISGTVSALEQLNKFHPPNEKSELYDPAILITFVVSEMIASQELQSTRYRLLRAYPDTLQPNNEPDLGMVKVKETGFSQELLYLSDFSSAISKLFASTLPNAMTEFVEEFVPSAVAIQPTATVSVEQARRSLAQLSQKLEYAESGQGDRYLSIAPLRALAKQFQETVPTAVIVGSKGAGKTYTCLQIVRSQIWSSFVVQTLRLSEHTEWGSIWPLLHSKNLDEPAKALIQTARRKVSIVHELPMVSLNSTEIEDRVLESLQHNSADERWWRIRWFKILADSLGIMAAGDNEAASAIVGHLRSKGRRLVVVIDGLEDLFPIIERSQIQQIALRALIQGVPNYLKEIPNSPLGILVFVRADLVIAAIPQNVGQFERLYEPFALRWDQDEALRLAVWIARESGGPIALEKDRSLELITAEEARSALIPIWGKKLGSERSREARTAEWVIAALSDFNGQIQARDLVRFFRYAAEKSIDASALDRVLIARAIRDAILPCSQQKIREIKQEIEPLNDIFDTLQRSTDRRIPFDAPKSGLKVEEIQFLIKTGILIEDQGDYFMPEIFRLGLGFQLGVGARPRVLSFARSGTR